jgi:sulfite reductase (NADPH) hemoprotein beta-component
MPETYPRLGDVIGFCLPEQVVQVAEKIVLEQRDNAIGKTKTRRLK